LTLTFSGRKLTSVSGCCAFQPVLLSVPVFIWICLSTRSRHKHVNSRPNSCRPMLKGCRNSLQRWLSWRYIAQNCNPGVHWIVSSLVFLCVFVLLKLATDKHKRYLSRTKQTVHPWGVSPKSKSTNADIPRFLLI